MHVCVVYIYIYTYTCVHMYIYYILHAYIMYEMCFCLYDACIDVRMMYVFLYVSYLCEMELCLESVKFTHGRRAMDWLPRTGALYGVAGSVETLRL